MASNQNEVVVTQPEQIYVEECNKTPIKSLKGEMNYNQGNSYYVPPPMQQQQYYGGPPQQQYYGGQPQQPYNPAPVQQPQRSRNQSSQSGCNRCIQALCCCTLCGACCVEWCVCCELLMGCCEAVS